MVTADATPTAVAATDADGPVSSGSTRGLYTAAASPPRLAAPFKHEEDQGEEPPRSAIPAATPAHGANAAPDAGSA